MEIGEPGLLDTFRFTDQLLYQEPLPEDYVSIHVRIGDTALQYLPDAIGETEAVSCVVAYITAYYFLIELARISQVNQSSSMQQLVILVKQQFSLHNTLVLRFLQWLGSSEKQALLMERHGISETHNFKSRDLTFTKGILRVTKGNGVDVALNSTHGEVPQEPWNCLADFGGFVEIGERDVNENISLEMNNRLRNIVHLFDPWVIRFMTSGSVNLLVSTCNKKYQRELCK